MISLHEGGGKGGGKKKKPADRVCSLLLKIASCRPMIWRRIEVKESMWLSRLHDSIQLAFDWYDYQTHVFTFGELRFGNPIKKDDLIVEDDRDVTLGDLGIESRQHFTYSYFFDEGWTVEITVEGMHAPKKGVKYPRCVAGERAGPPEDCGGPEAHHDMLHCIKEPETELGREWLEWLGPGFDAELCDLEKINTGLKKLSGK